MVMTLLLLVSLIQGVTLSGTVRQPDDQPIPDAIVTALGPEGALNTTSNKEGKFTFRLSRPGYVQLSAKQGKLVGQSTTLFVGQDMDGVGIVLRPSANPIVLGSIKVEGDQPLPQTLPRIVIKYPSGSVAGRYDIGPRGLFFFAVTPLEFEVSLENLKEPYFVKSMTAGDLDLMKHSVKLTDTTALKPILITLGIRQ